MVERELLTPVNSSIVPRCGGYLLVVVKIATKKKHTKISV